MTKSYEIRRATIGDIDGICALLTAMHTENAFFDYDRMKAYEKIQDCIINGYVVVGVSGEEVVGSIGLGMMAHWYSNDRYLGDYWTFVHPNHRNSHLAVNLLKHVIGVSGRMGVPLSIGVLSGKRTGAKNRLFRRFMTPVGETFMRGIPDVRRRQRVGR